jgi:pleckstrin homology domain-containing family A member 1/2
VLFPTRLCYYSDEKEYEILKIISLEKIHSVAYVETKKRPFVFALITKERTWYYQAEDHSEMETWIQTIRNQIKILDQEIDIHPHEIHLHQPPTLQSPALRMPSNSLSIPIPGSNTEEFSGSPTDYPSFPSSPIGTLSNALSNRVGRVSYQPESFASPLAQTWAPKIDSESDEDPPISAVLAKLPGDDIVHCQGWLFKLKNVGGIKTWKRHWYVLRNGKLISYKDETEYEVCRMIELITVLDILDIEPLRVKPKQAQHLFKVVLPNKTWILCAESDQQRQDWLKALNQVHGETRT